MTNQRKIFGAVLTLAMSAFGVDHWFGGAGESGGAPPAQAQAQAPPGAKASRNAKSAAADAAHQAAAPARTLAARLLEAARAEQLSADGPDATAFVPDAFKPSSLWYPAPTAAPATAAARPSVPPERLEEFRARHRLTAVMRTAGAEPLYGQGRRGGGLAIIGGKVYSPGQTIDGFTLASIGERSAVLTFADASVELKIDPPDALSSLSGQ